VGDFKGGNPVADDCWFLFFQGPSGSWKEKYSLTVTGPDDKSGKSDAVKVALAGEVLPGARLADGAWVGSSSDSTERLGLSSASGDAASGECFEASSPANASSTFCFGDRVLPLGGS
jgi:hypothetical protein